MTIEFTTDQWTQQSPDVFIAMLTIDEALDKPLMQVFKYGDPETKLIIGLIIPKILSYIVPNNMIMIQYHEPFSGYVVAI
ncbi:hypothetical protein [Chryseobacterium sp. JV558]|uniref:hypothetical protein n=1 Tax=Chryseobacterium sp. JV558 TaxID=2663236 RepID=UPI00299F3302|nr:hypothetical protein [Chryseobacterium sp. JV558]MDW9379509.1 hypothetical protein [Chryseobacterium sp. JV558]